MNGLKEAKLDKKRIILSKDFGINPEEKVVPMLDSRYPNIAFIYPEEEFEYRAGQFLDKLEEEKKSGKITREEYNQYIRQLASECAFPYEKLDSQRRIILDDQIINSLQLTDSVIVIGDKNKLVLCKDVKDYNNYLEEVKSKTK